MERMTYLANICYKVPIKILWIRFHVFREGKILITADSDNQAIEKMKEYERLNSDVEHYTISRSL